MWLGADQKSAFTWWENVRLNLWQVEKTLKGHWKTTKGIYSHFYWILRCWLLRKLNSAIGKIRAIFGAPITPLLQCPTMCKGCGWLICTGHWLQKVGFANCDSKISQFASNCTDTLRTIQAVQRIKSVVMNNMLCQSTLLPCQCIYTSGAMSDFTIEMSVCVELCCALVSATQKAIVVYSCGVSLL